MGESQRILLAKQSSHVLTDNLFHSFAQDHNLNIPFQCYEEFQEFEQKLTDEAFRNNFVSTIYTKQ